ncbi:hypothetical protein [Erwinia amylovora]|uniref:hypothetical protein n=1 Tax=Erwinia amylovora TaxID=552 RepID=UPI001443ADBF|nr:hypothetical protein [Erwinia amylovora]
MKKHMKVKELIAAAHSTANDLQPEASTLLREVAIRLDVTFAALTESLEIRRVLEAELQKMRGR